MASSTSALGEVTTAARLWQIWWRLGLQDVRLRFRRSAFGVGWIFIHFAVPTLAVGVIYGHLFDQDLRSFLPFLTVGLVVWGFLTSAVAAGGQAFLASEGYIKQIGLPVQVYVFRCFVSTSTAAAISLLAYVIVAVVCAVPFGRGMLWAVVGFLLVGATAFFLIVIFAHLAVRFRDTPHAAAAGLHLLFYVTPVLWPPDLLRGRLAWVIDANPLYHLLEVVRQPLLFARPAPLVNYVVAGAGILALALLAGTVVRRYARRIVYLL
jgi:ABC-type polysaccharide/polyol phosphate export permease